jgi:hypothetical protein
MSRTPLTQSGRTAFGAMGTLAVAGILLWAAGPLGLFAGAVIALASYFLSGVFAVAIGHLLVLPLLPGPTPETLAALEAGFLAILLAPLGLEDGMATGLAASAAGALVLGGLAWVGWHMWEPRWLAALVVVGLVALGLYGLHRYTVVLLDLEGGAAPT